VITVILSVIIAIMLFLCAFLGFREGLRLGKDVANGIMPEKIRSPMAVVKDIKKEIELTKLEKEQAKEEAKHQEDLHKLMSYTGEVEDED
jgi:hypothetical protein